ncbi:MAG TPA: hypothetical protein VFN09_01320 [Rhodanobacteraceae bacterium]|nr:hypothetical protein [Rhodanobacteraceae bacterium]
MASFLHIPHAVLASDAMIGERTILACEILAGFRVDPQGPALLAGVVNQVNGVVDLQARQL